VADSTLTRFSRNVVQAPPRRMTRSICCAPCAHRIRRSSGVILAAYSGSPTCGVGVGSGPARQRTSCSQPAATSSRRSSSAVIAAPIGTRTVSYTPPVSRPSSNCIRHTPVSASPASTARSTGAAPRQRGSSEKCEFTIGTSASTCGLISWPNATTTPNSMPLPSTSSTSWLTGSPRASAACFTGEGLSSPPRPRRLSTRVTTIATSWPAATRAVSDGTAIAGVPK